MFEKYYSPLVQLDPENQEHQVSLGDPEVENNNYASSDTTNTTIVKVLGWRDIRLCAEKSLHVTQMDHTYMY